MQVDNVDLSVKPVSYSVLLEGGDHFRETESPRLKPRSAGVPAPSRPATPRHAERNVASQQADSSEDDFGNFSGAGDSVDVTASVPSALPVSEALASSPVLPPTAPESTSLEQPTRTGHYGSQHAIDWRTTRNRPHTAQAAFNQPREFSVPVDLPQGRHHTVGAAFSVPPKEAAEAEGEDDDEFGDFEQVDEPAAIAFSASHPRRYCFWQLRLRKSLTTHID